MDASLFKLFSVGSAAENLALSARELECLPHEIMGYVHGEITGSADRVECSGVDYFGQKYTSAMYVSNCLRATWLPIGSNRITPPNIRRGERVFIWRYADTDTYWWTDTAHDGYLRRLETVVYAWSGTKDESVKVLSPANSYYLEISTHDGHVSFSTSKANGEPFGYMIQINTKEGAFTVTDDDGQIIQVDSAERQLIMQNKDGTVVDLNKKVLTLTAADTINMSAKTFNGKFETWDQTASKTNLKVGEANMTGSSLTATLSGGTIFNGVFRTNGLFTFAGGFTAIIVPGQPVPSMCDVFVNVDFKGTIKHDGVSIGKTHVHVSGAPGDDTSGVNP